MFGQCFRLTVRFRLRTLLALTAIVACWLAWNVRWIQQRREFIAEYKAQYAARHSDSMHYAVGVGSVRAPLPLRLFGESGFEALQFDVYVAEDLNQAAESYGEVQQELTRARRLFPEAEFVDVEPVLQEAR